MSASYYSEVLMEMNLEERKVSSREIYDGKVLHVRCDEVVLPNGAPAVREYVHHIGAVAILPLTDEGEVILERQFRYPFGDVLVEIPAGKLHEGEDPLVCAKRELLEETGLTAEKWEFVGSFRPSPGYTDELLYIYIAKDLSEHAQNLDEDEFLDVEKFNIIKAIKKIEKGETL